MPFRPVVPLVILAASLLASLPLPASGGREDADRFYAQGREQLVLGNHREAEQFFTAATRENPMHGEAILQLASLRSRNIETYEKAEDLYLSIPDVAGKAGGKNRDDLLYRAGIGLGKLYVRSGRNGQAIALLRNTIASAPGGIRLDEAYNTLGLAYYYERLYEDAIFEMRKAIKINPNNDDAKLNLKTIRTRLEHFQAGKLYSRLGDRPRAISEYRKAIDLDPRFIEARHRLGVELYLSGNPMEAIKELRRAALVLPDYRKGYEIWYAEGLALARIDRQDEALAMFRKVVKVRPAFAPAHNELGKGLLQRSEYDAAVDHFVKAIGADPKAEYARGLQIAMTRKAQAAAKETPAPVSPSAPEPAAPPSPPPPPDTPAAR
jgi:tetratricopeptide (TPR) repeat protein